MTDSPFALERFVDAQGSTYPRIVAEIRGGRKTGHWIWFIFPQVTGLGRSDVSRYYAISSIAEARAYLAHPLLGPRLRECADALLSVHGRSASDIFGPLDAMKVRSSMTLFHRADPDDPRFRGVLVRFYGSVADSATDEILAH